MKIENLAPPGLWIKEGLLKSIEDFKGKTGQDAKKARLSKENLKFLIRLCEPLIVKPTGGNGPIKVKEGKILFYGVHLEAVEKVKGGAFEVS